MFKAKLYDGEIDVEVTFDRHEKALVTVGKQSRVRDYTECNITVNGVPAVGYAIRNPVDQPNWSTGRKVAFARAVQRAFDREQIDVRRALWGGYSAHANDIILIESGEVRDATLAALGI